jgi:hypothetical protein
MDFLESMEKILDLVRSSRVLSQQIIDAYLQIRQVTREEIAGKNSETRKVPLGMKTTVLLWLTAHHQQGLTAKELFNNRSSLENDAGMKLSQRVEAYSMCLKRLDEKYVTRKKQGKEWRYFITDKGFWKTLDLIERAKIEENSRKIEQESRKNALIISLITKTTTINMQQKQLMIEKIPQIFNIDKAELEIYSTWGKDLVEAAESIRMLQTSASNPDDLPTRDAAVAQGARACNGLMEAMNQMVFLVCLKCSQTPRP